MVCNNSTIKYVLSWTLACKVSGQEQLPFQTEKKKKEEKKRKQRSLVIWRMNLVLVKRRSLLP